MELSGPPWWVWALAVLLWKIRNNQGSIAIEHYGGLLIEAQKEIDCRPERVEKGE